MTWPSLLVWALDTMNRRGKALACRLTCWTGKSPVPIHPKHLVSLPWREQQFDFLKADDFVVDLGAGNGGHTVAIAQRAGTVRAVDHDPQQLAVAKTRVEAAGLGHKVSILPANIERTRTWRLFTTGMWDAVVLLDTIEHLYAPLLVLTEIHRVLRPPGLLLISAPNRTTTWRRRLRGANRDARHDPDHKVEYDIDEFLAALDAAGFVPVGQIDPIMYDTPLAGLIDMIGGFSLGLYRRLATWRRAAALRHPEEGVGFLALCRRRD